jgi:hypothetical protein
LSVGRSDDRKLGALPEERGDDQKPSDDPRFGDDRRAEIG